MGQALGEEVALFMSTYVNKVDRKGRVSVPATFRAQLIGSSFPGIAAYPLLGEDVLEAAGIDRMQAISAASDDFEQPEEQRQLYRFILSRAQLLPFDPGGPHPAARAVCRLRPYHRERRLCRARPDLPDLGAGSSRRGRRPLGRTHAPAERQDGAARGRRGRASKMNRQRPGRPRAQAAPPPAAADHGCPAAHVPVLVDAVVTALAPRDDALYVDATFGGGGHSRALLGSARCRSWRYRPRPRRGTRRRRLAQGYGGRLRVVEGRFGEMVELLGPDIAAPIAGIAFDLGLSSIQLDTPARGFSFRVDGPLDMRMSSAGSDAAELVAALSEAELCDLIDAFGEERFARRIARAIVAARRRAPIRSTHGSPRSCATRCRGPSPVSIRRRGPFKRSASPSTTSSASRSRAGRGRAVADAGRPPRRRLVSFARGPQGQGFLASAQRDGAAPLAPRTGADRPALAEL